MDMAPASPGSALEIGHLSPGRDEACFPGYLGNQYSVHYVGMQGKNRTASVYGPPMSQGKTLFVGALLLVAVVLAVPAVAGDDPDFPQLDPRALHYSQGEDHELAVVGGSVYLLGRHLECVDGDDPLADLALCIYGPILLETTEISGTFEGGPAAPLLTVIYLPDDFADDPWDVVATGGDGVVQLSVTGALRVHVAEVPTDGSTPTQATHDVPCDATSRAFDAVSTLLWFSCGPIALNYDTGSQTIYARCRTTWLFPGQKVASSG